MLYKADFGWEDICPSNSVPSVTVKNEFNSY